MLRSAVGRRFLSQAASPREIYHGPLANVAKKLKLFSITSLGLGVGIAPFVYLIDVPVPFVAKTALVGAAVATSAASTGLIQWVMSPYVTKITQESPDTITLHTLSFLAKEHSTTVPINALAPASRIFTSLMITDPAHVSAKLEQSGKPTKPKMLFYVHPELCEEEGTPIKEIVDKTGIGKGF
ncbi:hypothetical protein BX666DRAFT_1852740 [Dichotomocladium elegans]|nr:hypothetical protein BX666DRAFT_1852740 [Dichotomocladium elegans]